MISVCEFCAYVISVCELCAYVDCVCDFVVTFKVSFCVAFPCTCILIELRLLSEALSELRSPLGAPELEPEPWVGAAFVSIKLARFLDAERERDRPVEVSWRTWPTRAAFFEASVSTCDAKARSSRLRSLRARWRLVLLAFFFLFLILADVSDEPVSDESE